MSICPGQALVVSLTRIVKHEYDVPDIDGRFDGAMRRSKVRYLKGCGSMLCHQRT